MGHRNAWPARLLDSTKGYKQHLNVLKPSVKAQPNRVRPRFPPADPRPCQTAAVQACSSPAFSSNSASLCSSNSCKPVQKLAKGKANGPIHRIVPQICRAPPKPCAQSKQQMSRSTDSKTAACISRRSVTTPHSPASSHVTATVVAKDRAAGRQ